jgi:Flp pilus assembly pilin Flp
MKRKRRKFLRRIYREQRGQSMVGYAVITAAILGGLITMSMAILPRMLDAYNNFTESLYFGINMPFP